MLHFDDIVFGPIFSRRLGSSLGVNILPSKGKLCNFDCIYCECGWNKDGVADRVFPRLAEVEAAMEEKMSKAAAEGVPVDSITFSGNGEPTMNPDVPEIIDAVASHNTGRPGMSRLSMCVCLADSIEPGREPYPHLDDIRRLAEKSLEKALLLSLEGVQAQVLSNGWYLHPRTRDTVAWLRSLQDA